MIKLIDILGKLLNISYMVVQSCGDWTWGISYYLPVLCSSKYCWLSPVFVVTDIMEPEGEILNPSLFPGQVQFGCGKLLVAGQWHHLTVTVAKEAKKSCIVSAYINSQTLGSAKVRTLCIEHVSESWAFVCQCFTLWNPCTHTMSSQCNHNRLKAWWFAS